MQTLLKDFKDEFLSRVLDIIWQQWNTLGVSGHGGVWSKSMIDPDALLISSCTLARYDSRLFDSIMDWLRINGQYINIGRINRMLRDYPYAGDSVFAAVAGSIRSTGNDLKWTRSAAARATDDRASLFFMADGSPLPVVGSPDPLFQNQGLLRDQYKPRDTAQSFRPEHSANLLLRLRAFLGVNARCEIIAYLLLNGRGSPRAMSRRCGYFPATVSKAMAEMDSSGYLVSNVEGRHRYYTLNTDSWQHLLLGERSLTWMNWIPLLAAIEQIWRILSDADFESKSPLAQASELRRLWNGSLHDLFVAAELPIPFGDATHNPGETLIPFFIAKLRAVLDYTSDPSPGRY